jgi:peroxiredoxin Q/BCP
MNSKINIGDFVPDFELFDQNLNRFKFSEEIASKNIILFFYPKDSTKICVKEACFFRDNYQKFIDHNIEIVGISSDSIDSHQDFACKNNLNFRILSDKQDRVRRLFGVAKFFGLIPNRETYIIGAGGRLLKKYSDYFDCSNHFDEAIKALEDYK